MRIHLLLFALIGMLNGHAQRHTTVNAVIGDSSWLEIYHMLPNEKTVETRRLRVHLNYVLARLKSSSTKNDGNSLSRKKSISLLEEYISIGEFPSSFSHRAPRTPCFIDDVGNICAVGYLVEKTAGRAEAERINERYRFHYLADINDAGLKTWQQSSGLSMKELAMIQPTYGAPPSWKVYQDRETKKYGLVNRSDYSAILEPVYERLVFQYEQPMYGSMAGFHMNGLAKKNGKWGVINSKGITIVPLTYDSIAQIPIQSGNNGRGMDFIHKPGSLFAAYTGNTLFLLNASNEVMTTFEWSGVRIDFQIDQLLVIETEAWWGIWNDENKKLIDQKYDGIEPSYHPRKRGFRVRKGKYVGVLDSTAHEMISCQYNTLYWRYSLWIGQNEKGAHILSANGKRQDTGPIELIETFNNYKDPVVRVRKDGKYGVWDGGQKKWRVPPIYEYALPVNQEMISVKKDGKVGYLKWDGSDLVPPLYDRLYPIGNYYMASNEDKMGVLDPKGGWKIAMEYDTIFAFGVAPNKGLALLKDGHWKLALVEGTYLSEERFTNFQNIGINAFVVDFDGEQYLAQLHGKKLNINRTYPIESHQYGSNTTLIYQNDDKYGLWRLVGEDWLENGKICDPIYDEVIPHYINRNGAFLVKSKKKFGVINTEGELLVPLVYKAIDHSHQSILYFKTTDGWYRYDYGHPLKKESERVNKILDERNS